MLLQPANTNTGLTHVHANGFVHLFLISSCQNGLWFDLGLQAMCWSSMWVVMGNSIRTCDADQSFPEGCVVLVPMHRC